MNLFGKKKEEETIHRGVLLLPHELAAHQTLEEERAEAAANEATEREIERREYCVSIAATLDGVTEQTFERVSERIYEYIYGKRP